MSDPQAAVARTATTPDIFPLRETALLGTLTAPGGEVALMRDRNGDIHRIRTGDSFGGFTVAAIGDGQVRMTRDGKALVFAMPQG